MNAIATRASGLACRLPGTWLGNLAAMFWCSRQPDAAADVHWSSQASQPTKPLPAAAPTARPAPKPQATSAEARILIVEDDTTSLTALARILQRRGYEVIPALTLKEARRLLDAPQFASIILDLMLPDGDGIEILREARIRRLPLRVFV